MSRILGLLIACQAALVVAPSEARGLLFRLPSPQTAPASIELRRGMVITSSARVVRRTYALPANPSLDSAVIVIRGDDITVDFNGAELRGTPRDAQPDAAAGVAIRIEGGHNVRVINAKVHGYRVGLMAVGTRGLALIDNDLSYSWKPRRVLGPSGAWKLVSKLGVASVSAESGRVGDTLVVTPQRTDEWSVRLEYHGGATLSPSGERRAASVPYVFSYGRFEPKMEWTVKIYPWPDSAARTLSVASFDSLSMGIPRLSRRESRIDYMWYRPAIKELPPARWAAEATTSVTLGPGLYTLRTISDDAIRVWVDGALVIDNWTPHESAVKSRVALGRTTRASRCVRAGRRLVGTAHRGRSRRSAFRRIGWSSLEAGGMDPLSRRSC